MSDSEGIESSPAASDAFDDDDVASVENVVDPTLGMGYERKTAASTNMALTITSERRQKEAEQKVLNETNKGHVGGNVVTKLRSFLQTKFGSITRGWRDGVDLRSAHKVGEIDFHRSLKAIGFPGNGKAAWEALRNERGEVTLADVDTSSAQAVSAFYRAFVENIGRMGSLVNGCESLSVRKETFVLRCKPIHKTVNLDIVFHNLHTNGAITAADCAWLEHYCERRRPSSPTRRVDEKVLALRTESVERRRIRKRQGSLDDFRTLLRHHYGSTIRAWRKELDSSGTGQLTSENLNYVATNLGFKGDTADLWSELAGDGYEVTLVDFEPGVPEAMSAFISCCEERFGSLAECFREFESAQKPLVTRDEFKKLCVEIKFHKNENLLFEYIDSEDVGSILLGDIDADIALKVFGFAECQTAKSLHEELESLPRIPERKTLIERAEEQIQQQPSSKDQRVSVCDQLLKFLTRRFGSPVRAWSCAMDRHGKGKLKKQEFAVAVANTGFAGNINEVWKELKLRETQSIKLKDLAQEINEDIKRFKSTALANLSDHRGYIVEDKGVNREIEEEEFIEMSVNAKFPSRAAARVFGALDLAGAGHVMTKTLRWLHDVKNVDKALLTVLSKHKDLQRKQLKQKMEAEAMESSSEIVKKQTKLLSAGREARAKKCEVEATRKSIIQQFVKGFGGVTRAWQLAVDSDRAGELDLPTFITGLRRAGFLVAKDKNDEDKAKLQLAEKVFKRLADRRSGLISLAAFDQFSFSLIHEFRRRCVLRFGSIAAAFLEMDPEATGVASTDALKRLCHDVQLSNGVHRLLEYLDPDSKNEVKLEDIDEEAMAEAEGVVADAEARKTAEEQRNARLKREHMLTPAPEIGVSCGPAARSAERDLEPGQRVLEEFRNKLRHRYGNLVRAWRKAFRSQPFIVQSQFKEIWEDHGMRQQDMNIAWVAFNPQNDRVELENLEPGVLVDVAEFKAKIVERYGSTVRAFEHIDIKTNYRLDKQAFLRLCYDCQFKRNDRRLFEYLDKSESGFMDLRDIDAEAVHALRRRKKPTDAEKKDTDDRDPAMVFRNLLWRRFGSPLRAWRNMDKQGASSLTQKEFVASLSVTGYAGSPTLLWSSLVGEQATHISLKEVEPRIFKRLSEFHAKCVTKYGSLRRVFVDDSKLPVKRFDDESFLEICKEADLPKPWGALFTLLANTHNEVTWEDVRFLAEQWTWNEDGKGKPVRRRPQPESRPHGRKLGSPARSTGEGPLATSMRPLKVSLRSSMSLPDLTPPIRAMWNDRHQIQDISSNKTEQLLHLMSYVQTQEQERIKIRVAQNIAETPTDQWLNDYMARM
eukprot:TRINITY_DN61908_c0_g1_i1.p1 TRINITY_DN61908_c0_g1~~TRINITY_DN61908_c0_g1_i1.p1  ORF type:complete len:1328 (+),score=228.30 TRINITY_DN61908_c0_g1_i1:204-4187(+)